MNAWEWREGEPYRHNAKWFTVRFPAEVDVMHPVRASGEGYDVANDLSCREWRHFESRQAVEDHLTDWRNNRMPIYSRLTVGDRVKFNNQWLYCWFGGWKWNRTGAWEHIIKQEDRRGTITELAPHKDGRTFTIVKWDGMDEMAENPGRPFIVELMPEDDPRTAFSFDAFEAHMKKCTRFSSHI